MSDSDATERAKEIRRSPEVEKLLRQFLTMEVGQGREDDYRRGYTIAFEWSESQRQSYLALLEKGVSKAEAFQTVDNIKGE